MTLTMERAKKARSLKKQRDPLESIPLSPAMQRLLENAEKYPERKLTRQERIDLIRWLKADLDDAMRLNGLR